MKINKNNYEVFFLDYSEGNLSSEQIAELKLFLESNPDLKVEFDFFESDIKLEPKNAIIDLDLKRILETSHSDEEMIIAHLEGDLSENESRSIEDKIKKDKEFNSLYQSFQRLQLKPDEQTEYDKNGLLLITIDASNYEELFVAYHEGDLSQVNRLQIEQYASENSLSKELNVYSRLKLQSDKAIVFEDKNALKRKDTKVIPLYAWVSSAAALLLLFFVLSQDSEQEEKLANEIEIEAGKDENMEKTIELNQEPLPLVQNIEIRKEDIQLLSESSGATKEKLVTKKEDKTIQKVDLPQKEQEIAQEEKTPQENIDPEKESDKEQDPQLIEPQEIIDEGIAGLPELENQKEVKVAESPNNKLNIITLAEKATQSSELISFNSNLNETANYNETTFSIGKFSFKRKTKRRKKS